MTADEPKPKRLKRVYAKSSSDEISLYLCFCDGDEYVSHELWIKEWKGATQTEFAQTLRSLANELEAKGDY